METWFMGGTSLGLIDAVVLVGTLGVMFFIGYWGGRHQKDDRDFFLGRGRIPWWAATLSFVATEISAMTVIGVPATAFRENWNYAQFFIGSAAARVFIAYIFIPAFYQYNSTTIYEFLRDRFGPRSQYAASSFFFVTRLLASGVRLMAACVAVGVLLGWHIVPTIALFTVVSVAYISYGGIGAVVWTNVLQALTFLGAGLLTCLFILKRVDGGLVTALHVAGEAGRSAVWNFGPAWSDADFLRKFFNDANVLWIAILNGFFGSLSAFGTDHEMTQKLLTVETRRESQKSVLLSIGGSLLALLTFLAVGTLLFVFYKQNPGLALPDKLDKIYPHFASTVMPGWLRGLVLTAIVMASIDSPLASLTAVFVNDIYKPLVRPGQSHAYYLKVSRWCVGGFALILAVIAWYFSRFDQMLWLAFKINGVTAGSLLGVFLLGMLTKRGSDRSNVAAMLTMAAINAVLLYKIETKVLGLGWSWLLLIGTAGTMAMSVALENVLGGRKPAKA
jgi:SSS family solute:Na+ symporter